MKLAVLGGGGVRSPLLAKSIAGRSGAIGLNKITFMDSDREKLRIYGGLAKKIAGLADKKVEFELTADPVEALKNADFVIATLRVGQEKARILDEKIALSHGVLGQETTGAGGFAMAMRSIPAIAEYCGLTAKYANSGALFLNFTNPSGLVTQALRDEGFESVYGICDGPSNFIKELEEFTGAGEGGLSVECFGLNHLSWYRSIRRNGKELIHSLINDPDIYRRTEMRFFDPELVRSEGMFPNSYLYYYYSRERAVENIRKSPKTRGEIVFDINLHMYNELCMLDIEKDFDRALAIYLKYHEQRERSYMRIESGDVRGETQKTEFPQGLESLRDEGYAGVALGLMEAYVGGREKEMVLIVPNNGSIDGLKDDDAVEVTCRIGKKSVSPVKIGEVPEIQMNLIRQVKLFERLASKAIRDKNIKTAASALMVHPLVNSYTLAKQLAGEYIQAHNEYIGQWK